MEPQTAHSTFITTFCCWGVPPAITSAICIDLCKQIPGCLSVRQVMLIPALPSLILDSALPSEGGPATPAGFAPSAGGVMRLVRCRSVEDCSTLSRQQTANGADCLPSQSRLRRLAGDVLPLMLDKQVS